MRVRKKTGEPITDNMVAKYIKTAKDVGLLFDTEDRAPMSQSVDDFEGKWSNISQLQAAFNVNPENSKWERVITYENNSTDTEVSA